MNIRDLVESDKEPEQISSSLTEQEDDPDLQKIAGKLERFLKSHDLPYSVEVVGDAPGSILSGKAIQVKSQEDDYHAGEALLAPTERSRQGNRQWKVVGRRRDGAKGYVADDVARYVTMNLGGVSREWEGL